MEKIGQIIEAIKKPEDTLNKDISLVINNKCKGKSKEEIIEFLDILLTEPPEETGGQNAITGFYFQLLCTLYYLAELLEGKWNFLIIELHQDIIVGNESTIKFVQVKSEVLPDRKPVKVVSETELYRGWIQKLFSLARLFPKGNEVTTQFELITNYIIKDSPRIKVEHYLYNNRFDQNISDEDHILQKVNKYKTYGLEEDFDIEKACNDSIKNLLSRFSINPKAINPGEFEDFMGLIGNKFGRLINESAGVSPRDLNYLLGELCYECNHSNQGSLLYIDKERAYGFLESLKKRASENLEGFYTANNSNYLIDEIITNLNENYLQLPSPIREQLEDEIENFRIQLKQWASEDISIVEMVHRYLEGKSFSLSINKLKPMKLKQRAEEIIKTLFILNIVFNKDIKFSKKFKGILIKEVSNAYVSILGLDMDQTLEEGIQKLSSILEKSSDEEKIYILMKNNHTIFQGDHDEDFINEETLKIEDVFKVGSVQQEKSLKEVDYIWTIIPGIKFISTLRKVRKFENIDALKGNIQTSWEILKNSR
jgi:hypothetical protein